MIQNIHKSEKLVAGVLRLGSILSIILMAAGLGLFLLKGGQPGFQEVGLAVISRLPAGVLALEPFSLMTLGVIVLMLTPFLRVVATLISFLTVERDLKYVLISLGVLVILVFSFFVPGFK